MTEHFNSLGHELEALAAQHNNSITSSVPAKLIRTFSELRKTPHKRPTIPHTDTCLCAQADNVIKLPAHREESRRPEAAAEWACTASAAATLKPQRHIVIRHFHDSPCVAATTPGESTADTVDNPEDGAPFSLLFLIHLPAIGDACGSDLQCKWIAAWVPIMIRTCMFTLTCLRH